MTKVKSNRIFLGLVTGAMALAGTGLTIANNIEKDFQMAAIAITLAACFSAAELTFLWGHKRFETSKALWRKIVLSVALVALVIGMALAVWEELGFALHKVANRSLASNSSIVVGSATGKNQKVLGWKALDNLAKDKVQSEPWPFVLCYLITGLVSIAILAVTEKQQQRTMKGSVVENNPALQERIKQMGFDPATVKAYGVSGGYSLYKGGTYQGFVSNKTVESPKKKMGFI